MPSARADSLAELPDDRYPIRGTFFGCCASAGKQRAKSMAQRARPTSLFVMCLSSYCLTPSACCLSDYSIRPRQHIRWNHNDFRFSILDFRLFVHRITLSALAKTLGGIVNPICLAV